MQKVHLNIQPQQPQPARSEAAFPAVADIPHLTGLRAVAALMVLLLHFDQIHGNVIARTVPPVAYGHLGVDIFFVLSGFIMSYVYAPTAARMPVRSYLIFLWRRLARIYPVHLAMLAALLAMVVARRLLDTNFWLVADLPRHLLLLHAWTDSLTWNLPAWSISAEWLAYVLFPVFVALMLRPASVLPAVATAAVLLLAFQVFVLAHNGTAAAFLGWPAALRVLSEFAMGVLGFRLVHSRKPSQVFDAVAVGALVVCFAVPVELVRVVAIGVAVTAIAASEGAVRKFLSTKPMVVLGTISYSIYMVHFLVLKLVQNINFQLGLEQPAPAVSPFLTLAWASVAVAAGAATYFAVERPARNWCRARETQLFRRRA